MCYGSMPMANNGNGISTVPIAELDLDALEE